MPGAAAVSAGCAKCNARKRARESRYVETPEMAQAAVRFVRALGKRAAEDVTGLPHLVELARLVDEQLSAAVAGAIVEGGWTWHEVGRELGISRQGAHKRFSRAVALLEAAQDQPEGEDAGQVPAAG
jgi:hypothetical protein